MELQNIDQKTPPASGQGAGGSFEQTTPSLPQTTGKPIGRFQMFIEGQ